MLKAPSVGKFLAPDPHIPEAWTFQKTFVRKDEALRLGEALSQLELGQLVHSVGHGKFLLRPAMKAVRAWHKSQYAKARNKLSKDADLAKLWAHVRVSRSNNSYGPYIFGRVLEQTQSATWTSIAAAALQALRAQPSGQYEARSRAKRKSDA
jgi:hypothetical protein